VVAISKERSWTAWLVVLLLVVITLTVYVQTLRHDFINYDDDKYVTKNPNLLRANKPVGMPALKWALRSVYAANWHPLTWASHILDLELWNTKPMGHHLSSLLLHLANVLVLFCVLKAMTGDVWKSGLVAGLFAVHPLHIESVAWVAERKDVLSTLFWMLTMSAYVSYARSSRQGSVPRLSRYLLTTFLFALGLMAKPMLVTLPFVLLLLDYWPLGRIHFSEVVPGERDYQGRVARGRADNSVRRNKVGTLRKKPNAIGMYNLLLEKMPLFALSAVSCIITYLAQARGRSLGTLEMLSPGVRVSNALVSYVTYLWKTIWPRYLAVFYPHPAETIPPSYVLLAVILLFSISYLVFCNSMRRPYLLVGWLWYLGTLVPVIGLVQVGGQAMADRYTYIPLIGIFIMVAWGLPDTVAALCHNTRYRISYLAPLVACLALLAFTICSYIQVGYWKNSFTLFRRALSVVESDVAHNNLGLVLQERGKIDQAIKHYAAALAIHPASVEAQGNLANAMSSTGRIEDAIAGYEAILEFRPDDHKAHNNLANALMKIGKVDEAIQHYYKAIGLNPSDPVVHYNLSTALVAKKEYKKAWEEICIARRYGFQGDPAYVKRVEQAAKLRP